MVVAHFRLKVAVVDAAGVAGVVVDVAVVVCHFRFATRTRN